MATTTTARSTGTKLATVSRAPIARRSSAPSKVAKTGSRRRGRSGGGGHLPSGTQLLMAAGLGWAQQQGHLARVPTIAQLGVEGTIAGAAYFWRRSGGPKWAGDLCTAAAIIAANHLGREGLTGVHGVGADDPYAVHGDE